MNTHRIRPVLRTLSALAVATASLHAASQPGQPADPAGRWITASGNLEVEIAPCGNALCGTVTKVLGNRSMRREGAAMEPVDARPALGMQLLRSFLPASDAPASALPTEWTGDLYNREDGKTYRCRMSVSTASHPGGELVLHAYIGIPLFGKTQRWQRSSVAAAAAAVTTD